jgi:hypothetical protein
VIYGREVERARIAALLADARSSRSGALVLRGDAGIGKTMLLDEAVARADGMVVLRASGVESEAELAFAGLHQVLLPLLELLPALPASQAGALASAFGLGGEEVGNRFLASLATLGLLAEAAGDRGLLCVIDDAHWLDGPTAEALLFAARRLEAEGVAMLFAARDGAARRSVAEKSPASGTSGASSSRGRGRRCRRPARGRWPRCR